MSNEREAFESWWTNDAEGTDNKAAAFEGWKARAEWQRSQEQEEPAELQVLLRKIWPLINGAKDAVHDEIKAAPSHGGGVAHTDCRSEDGITVGLIDSIITSCRVLSSRDLTCEAAVEALRDLRSDSDVSLIKPSHGEQVRDGWQLVPVEPTPEMLDCIMDWQKIGNVTAYRAMLAAARLPVQEPARNPDVLALNAAREIMALVYGPTPLGRSPQLLAQIQCVVSEAIVYAAQEKK